MQERQVKNESSFLQPAQDTPATRQPATPTVLNLPMFRSGTPVTYQGQRCTVSHVVISRSQLLVHLHELGQSVDAEKVQVAPTRIVLQRT